MDNFFSNLKVIELSSVLAGPAAGMFFAELGARVIKVENKQVGGDVTRNWLLPNESPKGPSAYYSSVNYLKTCIQLDLNTEDDRNELYELLVDTDIIISNFGDSTAKKLGMDFEKLKSVKEDLIFLQLDGFYDSERPAFDVVLQAETGWISMTGTRTEEPAKLPVALVDVIAGHQLKEAALLGIIHKMRTGEGGFFRCNLEQASLSALANQATNFLMEEKIAVPMGTLHPNIAPYGDWFTASNGKRIVLAVGSDAHFSKLCSILEIAHIAHDSRFATNRGRVKNRIKLSEILQDAIGPSENLEALFVREKIPFGEIKTLDNVLKSSAAKNMIRSEEIEGKMTYRLSGNAFTAEFLKS